MSEMFMEKSFPLAAHPEAETIRRLVRRSLFVDCVSDEIGPLYYTRFSWPWMAELLKSGEIVLTPDEEGALIDFGSAYASLVDQEEDDMDLEELRKGDKG